MTWNPWRTIRELRARIAYLEGRMDEVCERAEEAEERAFHRASGHYYQRLRIEEERNRHMAEQMIQLSNLSLSPGLFTGGLK